jgi:hypothetical protein
MEDSDLTGFIIMVRSKSAAPYDIGLGKCSGFNSGRHCCLFASAKCSVFDNGRNVGIFVLRTCVVFSLVDAILACLH